MDVNKALAPLGGLDDEGILSWCPNFESELDWLLFDRHTPQWTTLSRWRRTLVSPPPTVAPLLFHSVRPCTTETLQLGRGLSPADPTSRSSMTERL